MTVSTHVRTCPLCEATCGLAIEVENGSVKRIRGDHDDVFSHGFLCPKGSSLKALDEDPDRVRTPLLRRPDGSFQPTDWATAFALIDERISPILAEHGKDAVGLYSGNPWSHNYESILYLPHLYNAIGNNRFAAASIDQRPREIVSGVLYGTRMSLPVPDLDRTDFFVLIGSDPFESNGSIATAPDWPGRLRSIQQRGGRFVVVDPRRSKTAEAADQHISIVPGTDAAFLAAIVNVLATEGLVKLGTVEGHIDGLNDVFAAVAPFTPEAVAEWCGVDATVTRQLARDLAAAPTAVIHGRLGVCLQDFATLSSWLVDVVNVCTGNLDRPGGSMFTKAAALAMNTLGKPGVGRGVDYATFHSRVKGVPGAYQQLPARCMIEEIETPGKGQIRALITIAGNPVLSTPDSRRLATALDSLEFMVSLDLYINETTRHADVILPAPTALQRSHYDLSYYQFSIRNIANYSPAVFPLGRGEEPEWRTISRLASICRGEGSTADLDAIDDAVVRSLVDHRVRDPFSNVFGRDSDELWNEMRELRGPERMLEWNLRTGPYGDGFGLSPEGLTFARLIESPHGIDLGALQPRIPEMLRTPSGRIPLGHELFVNDLGRLLARLDEERPALVLVGRRHLRSNNSWQHNLRVLVKGKDRCVLQLHPDDAVKHGLATGELVRCTTDAASVEVAVEVTDSVPPGVVSLPHGWGHDVPGTRLHVAAERPGVNSNALATNDRYDPLSGNPHLNGFPVTLERPT